ncbi:hypothetical protein [Paenibacillus methanolicus]|uniref:Glycosyl transferase family 2 n=1 Tax=Paenibacillus methanolicus TaxID=582686 RepID=A0A5S5CBJ3_9BACL|nr:hypothetical protein [Paenibacillus methanolicus]TYP75716.1 hypothetical protein BCM02_104397 [Paenibacillus methanolicus]
MIEILLWVVGCYLVAAALVHAAFRLREKPKAEHYVLLAGNEQQRMEWYMRGLRRYSHRSGKEVQVTIIDRGSEDDTVRIASLFAKKGMDVQLKDGTPFEGSFQSALQGARNEQPAEVIGTGERKLPKWKRLLKVGQRRGQTGARAKAETFEPTHLMWMLQAEGIITEPEHAVLVDLREPSDWSKLPQ